MVIFISDIQKTKTRDTADHVFGDITLCCANYKKWINHSRVFTTAILWLFLCANSFAAIPTFENSTPNASAVTATGATVNVDLSEEGTVYYVVVADGAAAPSVLQVQNGHNSTDSAALASGSFATSATTGSDLFTGLSPSTDLDLYLVAEDLIGPNVQTTVTLVNFTTAAPDANGTVSVATSFTSETPLDTANTSAASAVTTLDFTITDAGGDGLPIEISSIEVHESGSANNTEVSRHQFLLNGPDATDVSGGYSGGTHSITFSGLNISIADGGSETYSVDLYHKGLGELVEGKTIILSVDGDTDFTLSASGTQMAATTSITNGPGAVISVIATQLEFSTQPSGSVSGNALTTQPVVIATDAFGDIDIDFTETITLTEASAGALTGNTASAVEGVATFSLLTYNATADQENFILTANDQDGVDTDLTTIDSSSLSADVVATQLVFSTQPAPTNFNSEQTTALTTVPVLVARDADNLLDIDYVTNVTLSEVNGSGSVVMNVTGDADSDADTVTLTPTAGTVTFTGLDLTYTNSTLTQETFNLQALSGALATVNSVSLTSDPVFLGNVTAATNFNSAIALNTANTTTASAVTVLDFNIIDPGGDGLPLEITSLTVSYSGSMSDAEVYRHRFLLNGPDETDIAGASNGNTDTITFSGLNISIEDGTTETYAISVYNPVIWKLEEGHTIFLEFDGNEDLTVSGTGTQMRDTSPISNAAEAFIEVVATQIQVLDEPENIVSGERLNPFFSVAATDDYGNTDVDFTEVITLTEASAGYLTGNTTTAVAGIARFNNLYYFASADQETFVLSVDDDSGIGADFTPATSTTLTADVVASQLVFATQPAPDSFTSGVASALTTVPVILVQDAQGIADTGYSTAITLTEVNGAGAIAMSIPSDEDTDATTVSLTQTSGSASYTGLQLTYTNAAAATETFNLRASSGTLPTVDSNLLTATPNPIVSAANITLTGATGSSGSFRIGDTVTVTWDNTETGDNNANISTVSADFSDFGGGAAISANNTGNRWSASYLINDGSIDTTNRNISITATSPTGSSTTADTSNATLDNIAPTVTAAAITLTGATGSAGEFIIGDTATASWDNTIAGDNNSDTMAAVSVDFSALGGPAAISATHSSGIWSATYILVDGNIEASNLNAVVQVTDNAGNTTQLTDNTNATVDNSAPGGHSVSFDDNLWNSTEASAAAFAFAAAEVGAAFTYQISSSAGGTGVTGSGTVSSATQSITGLDLTGLNDGTLTLSVILTDSAGNPATAVTDTSALETQPPSGHSVSFTDTFIGAAQATSTSFRFTAAEVGATYNYTINSSAGGIAVSGSGTISSPTQTISGLDVSGLNNGTLTLTVVLTDTNDNVATDVIDTATLDKDAPGGFSVAMSDALINGTQATSIAFSFTAAEIGSDYHFTITSDNGGTPVTGSGTISSANEMVAGIDVSGLNDGMLTLSAALTDISSNSSAAQTATTQLDATAPVLTTNNTLTVVTGTSELLSTDNLTATDTISPANAVIYQITANTTQGMLSNNGSQLTLGSTFTQADIANNLIRYSHTASTSTADSFTLTLSDAAGNQSTAQSFMLSIAANSAPTLSGSAATFVNAGVLYSFTPSAADADSADLLTFSISNRPPWASFNSATGRLSGTPALSDIAIYSNILISVTDGKDITTLPAFQIAVIDALDSDADGVSDPQEGIDGTDPNDPNDYLDTTAPVLTAPGNITVDATGLLTTVSLAELLGLNADTTSADVNTQLSSLAIDNIDGNACCHAEVEGMINDTLILAPGIHTIIWQASDLKGNTATATQTVRVRPLVSFGLDVTSTEGDYATVTVLLNGTAPDYPFQVPIIVDTNRSSADASDHDFSNRLITFLTGETEQTLTIHITGDSDLELEESLVLILDDQTTNSDDLSGGYDPLAIDIYDINAGNQSSVTVNISANNLPPEVDLVFEQNGQPTIKVSPTGGVVTVRAAVTDLNTNDTFTFDWHSSNQQLFDIAADSDDETFQFDPSSLSAQQHLAMELTVTDSAGATDTAIVYGCSVESIPSLNNTQDSDNDGTDDLTEGMNDADHDGIPNYLDNISASNILPATQGINDSDLLECEPGTLCRLGQYALCADINSARLTDNITDSLNENTGYSLVGGVYDFEIHNLSTPGQSTRIVLPQTEAIPEEAQYHKYIHGTWTVFVENANNQLHSAPGAPGTCPPPGDNRWQAGLNAGDFCIQLTIEDGGPNDSDGIANGVIEDPGSLAVNSNTRSGIGGGTGVVGALGVLPCLLTFGLLFIRLGKYK